MDKMYADKMIAKFQTIFYGFARSRTYTIDEAEELASRIILEAYVTLLKVDDISNWEGYLYRIACNVYARYVKEIRSNRNLTIDDMEIMSDVDFTKEIMRSEDYKLIKREVSWLSKTQREIIYMHYYKGKKIAYISRVLKLPEGTVKWHLHDAKKNIKEGLGSMRSGGVLGIKPVSFCNMGHIGWVGDKGDTSDFLNTKLRQNIAYAAYFEAKTIEEIASELGVSPVYIEDEVEILEEYGYIDKLSGRKYLTNIKIDNTPQIAIDKIMHIQKEIAQIICDEYIPLLVGRFSNYRKRGIYIPEGDFEYLLWSLVPLALGGQIFDKAFSNPCLLDGTHYSVKRKDGGVFIAHASVVDPEKDMNSNTHYHTCGDMTRGSMHYPVASWQLGSDFDLREFGWRDNLASDIESLYVFMIGKIDKNEATLDKFRRLYDRGLIINKNGKDEINVIIAKVKKDANNSVNGWRNDLSSLLPSYSEDMILRIKEKMNLIYEIEKKYYPKHMHKLVKYYAYLDINKIMVLDELVDRGVLKPLSQAQKKGVMTIVFSDILPN